MAFSYTIHTLSMHYRYIITCPKKKLDSGIVVKVCKGKKAEFINALAFAFYFFLNKEIKFIFFYIYKLILY